MRSRVELGAQRLGLLAALQVPRRARRPQQQLAAAELLGLVREAALELPHRRIVVARAQLEHAGEESIAAPVRILFDRALDRGQGRGVIVSLGVDARRLDVVTVAGGNVGPATGRRRDTLPVVNSSTSQDNFG